MKSTDQKSIQIPRDEETPCISLLLKSKGVYRWKVSKSVRPRSSIGKYYTRIFTCANSNLAVHHRFIFIKTDLDSVKGTEKPTITSPRQVITLPLPSQ